MTVEILMPALSPTMEEGTLAKWLVKAGDSVASGDVIAEIETDKATMEVEAVDEGIVTQLLVAEGTEGVAVNAVIALLAEEGEDPTAAPTPAVPAPVIDTAAAPAAPAAPISSLELAQPEPEWDGAPVEITVREALRDAMAEEMRAPTFLLYYRQFPYFCFQE